MTNLLKVTKNNLDVELIYTQEQIIEKKNINDILKDFWRGNLYGLQMQFTAFNEYYNILFDELKIEKKIKNNLCGIVLNMCNFSIPQMRFTNDLSSSIDDIKKNFNSYQQDNVIYYEFNTQKDLISIIIYHYICSGFKFKQCRICDNFFLTKHDRSVICNNEKCKKENKGNNERKRLSDPCKLKYTRICDMLTKRTTNYEDNQQKLIVFQNEYIKNQEIMNDKDLLNWLEEQDKEFKRR